MFLRKGVLKICSKFTGEHPCRSAISIIEIPLRHGRSPVNLLHIFKTSLPKNISGWLLLQNDKSSKTTEPDQVRGALNFIQKPIIYKSMDWLQYEIQCWVEGG